MRYRIVPLLVLIASCGDDEGGLTSPTTGVLEIRTATSGAAAADYTVSVDGGTANPIGVNATITVPDLEAGSHTVLLGGLPEGCTVADNNPRTVDVTANATTTVAFTITCTPPVGSIQVVTATTGPGPASFELLLDGASLGAIESSTTRSLESIPSGVHSVGLSGLPANCQLQGTNPQSTTVATGATATVSFAITCTVPPAETGTLSISTTTTGIDPDGYQITVDATPPQPISASGTVTLPSVAAGSHQIRLSGLAAGCSVSGGNRRNVTVTTGATTTVSFTITCATTGSIRVITATTGSAPDADGYAFVVDNGAQQTIGASTTVTVPDLPAGPHTVALLGLAVNCTLEGESTRTVTVVNGATAEVKFAVTCPGEWNRMESGTGFHLYSVWGSSATDVFTLGEPGERFVSGIFHYNGQAWSSQSTHQGATLQGIWGTGPSDVFAVGFSPLGELGNDGVLLHYNGTGWTQMTGPGVGTEDGTIQAFFYSVWGTSGSDVFAVGQSFAADGDGLIAHFDGTSWSSMTLPPAADLKLTDVFGTSPQDVYAVGYVDPFGDDLRRARQLLLRRNRISNATILHYDGTAWTEAHQVIGSYALNGVWASAPNDVFVVGSNGTQGVIFHYNGTAWSPMPSPTTGPLSDIWGASSNDVYAAGRNGLLHYDGTAWTKVTGVTQSLNDVWGSSATNVFAVGGDGTIIHGTPGALVVTSRP